MNPKGKDVLHWPEFLALAERLGIDVGEDTVELSIHLSQEEVLVEKVSRGKDKKSPKPVPVPNTRVRTTLSPYSMPMRT